MLGNASKYNLAHTVDPHLWRQVPHLEGFAKALIPLAQPPRIRGNIVYISSYTY